MNLSRVSNPPISMERQCLETLNTILNETNHIWAPSQIKAPPQIV